MFRVFCGVRAPQDLEHVLPAQRSHRAEGMARMLDSIGSGLYRRPRGGVYYSCVGRGPRFE